MRLLIVYPFAIGEKPVGGAARLARLIAHMDAAGHDVFLAHFHRPGEEAMASAAVARYCCGITAIPVDERSRPRRALDLLVSGEPSTVLRFRSARMFDEIGRTLAEEGIDLLHIEMTYLGGYVEAARGTSCATVLVDEELDSRAAERLRRTARLSPRGVRAAWEAGRAAAYEQAVAGRFDRVYTITEEERAELVRGAPGLDVGVYPNCVDTSFFQPVPSSGSDGLCFVANFGHYPNVDGILWFAREVLPLIEARRGGCRLEIVGVDPPLTVRALDRPPVVHVLGRVDDIRPHLASCGVFICPLVNGGGMRGKVLEAMTSGRPVVSTPIGVEGLPVRDGVHARVAESSEDFATAVCDLLDRPEEGVGMAQRARELVARDYADSSVFARLESEYEELVQRKRARAASALRDAAPVESAVARMGDAGSRGGSAS